MVHDVIQCDDRVICAGKPTVDFLVSDAIDRRDDIVVDHRRIERRRRSIEQVIEERRGVARVCRDGDVADGRVRPGHEGVIVGDAAEAQPRPCEARQVVVGGGARGRHLRLDVSPARRAERSHARAQSCVRLVQRLSRFAGERGRRRSAPVPAAEQQREQIRSRAASVVDARQLRVQPALERAERVACFNHCLGRVFDRLRRGAAAAQPVGQAPRKQDLGGLAFAQGSGPPLGRARLQRAPRRREEGIDCAQARGRRLQARARLRQTDG